MEVSEMEERKIGQIKEELKAATEAMNSKPSGTSSCQQTSKKDKIKHGRGIRSVRKVAEKYGGELILKDQGEHFEAVLLLNGVAKLE